MRTYTIIGGVNGTGKSSLTGVLRTQTTDLGTIIDVDKITAIGGLSPIEGGKIALQRILECLEKGVSFTQETTLSEKRTETTAAEAKRMGYFIRLYYVGLDIWNELRTASGMVAIIFLLKSWSGASPDAGNPRQGYCPTVMRLGSSITTTVS